MSLALESDAVIHVYFICISPLSWVVAIRMATCTLFEKLVISFSFVSSNNEFFATFVLLSLSLSLSLSVCYFDCYFPVQ